MATELKQFSGDEGLAPYGLRHSGEGVKGKGYFGGLPTKSGRTATEISSENDEGEYPLIVPTLTKKELDHLLADKKPTDEIYDKAESWARTRKKSGKSPFAEPTELRMPIPKKKGGKITHYKSAADAVKAAQKRGDKSITVKFNQNKTSKRADGIATKGFTKGRMV